MRHSSPLLAVATSFITISLFLGSGVAQRQQNSRPHVHVALPPSVPLQPLAQQVRQIESAMKYLGQPLPAADRARINEAIAGTDEEEAVRVLQVVLDKYVLAVVEINPESRVKVLQGSAPPDLVEGGTRLFLVKVVNEAGVTARLSVESPNTGQVYIRSRGNPEPASKLTLSDVRER